MLGSGDSFSYTFSSMDFVGDVSGAGPRAGFKAYFTTDLLDPGESVRLDMFENSLSGSPVASRDITVSSTPQSEAEVFVTRSYALLLPWQDVQGVVRFTMLSGSANLDRIAAYTQLSTDMYGVLIPVPEPSSLTLLCVGLVAGAVSRRKRQQAQPGGSRWRRRGQASIFPLISIRIRTVGSSAISG